MSLSFSSMRRSLRVLLSIHRSSSVWTSTGEIFRITSLDRSRYSSNGSFRPSARQT